MRGDLEPGIITFVPIVGKHYCDFENGTCDDLWNNNGWSGPLSGGTPTEETGPTGDATPCK